MDGIPGSFAALKTVLASCVNGCVDCGPGRCSRGIRCATSEWRANAIEPGILLMDEGLGTGDARFAEHAAKRMEHLIDRSQILVFASHSRQRARPRPLRARNLTYEHRLT